MNIIFKVTDKNDKHSFEILQKWYNDNQIKPLISHNVYAINNGEITAEDLMFELQMKKHKSIYMICDDANPIGEVSVDTNYDDLSDGSKTTGWVTILIGETDYWGKGVASLAMAFIEKECIRIGCNRIELGIFAFNKRAIAFYTKLGYKEIRKEQKYTLNNGKWTVDIRMEKTLV